ncbi:MAG: inorganic phosphate transporter [Chloroflexi bacterium]|nr:inorganic phosphate transporter [Chloroflexota bacterium]
MPESVIFLIILALIFNFLNGFHDSSNIVAPMISSRAVKPQTALGLIALAEFVGPFVFGIAVAKTIGDELVTANLITLTVIAAALLAAIAWNVLTWYLGIPSSSSHALVGGLIGAVAVHVGIPAIRFDGLEKTLIALFISPPIGLLAGYLLTKLIYFLARRATPSINWFFKRSQIITGVVLGLSHGANDGQKTMGIITLALVTSRVIDNFAVPTWVVLVSSIALALGTAIGGWRLIRTLGGKFYKIRPVHGFATQVASSAVILGASFLGGPVSTTQVVSSTILGVGSAQRINMVRWSVAGEIVVAWLLTIPATALLAAIFKFALNGFPK